MNVLEASVDRIEYIFNEFDNIYVSFSGGKDSGVLLNLCIDYIRSKGIKRKIGVFHIDYEAQYQMTTDYVQEVFAENQDILDVYMCCMPVAVTCATSMHQAHWIPWGTDHKDIWVRDLPENSININNHEFDFFVEGMWDYDFQNKFSTWIHKRNNAKKTCCLVGIRTDESLNRWRAIHSEKSIHKYKGKRWTKKMETGIYNAYPIFDWKASDIWKSNNLFGWTYNKMYDLFHQAGLTIDQMRCASPFIGQGIDSLKLYKCIDPNMWGKMIGRVNGVNFSGIYGGTTAMGWKSIKLPKNHTWKSYFEFLLTTLPETAAENYKKKLETSINFWKERGGVLDKETINHLRSKRVNFRVKGKTNYKTNKIAVTMDYQDDTSCDDFTSIPTYKRMCICVMKNDHLCKYMGFSLNKTETAKRKEAEMKYKEQK